MLIGQKLIPARTVAGKKLLNRVGTVQISKTQRRDPKSVIQQIFFRYRQGQTDDPRFAAFGPRVTYLARAAAASAQL